MAEVKAQSISAAVKDKLDPKKEAEMLAAKICYYYPRYSFHEALAIPYKHVRLLLQTAEREKAAHYFTLTQIAAAAYTDKHSGFTKLAEQFKKIMDM